MDRANDVWVAELMGGNESAIDELRGVLLRNLRRSLGGRPRMDDAFLEDAVQESLIKVMDKLGQYSGRSRFVTWATSIAIHVALAEMRRSRWRDVSLSNFISDASFEPAVVMDTSESLDLQLERQAILSALYAGIETDLSDKQRIALLAELQGMSQEAIASHLGSNRNAIYKLTHDARKRLKHRLESLGFTAADVLQLSQH